ncbi:hypothetical protein C4F40_17180 [Sphingobacterium sp. Ka21]|uniref:Uncharacterized protein n=2 Tax=Sphingobacterium pedocola TaxID=2082722 RepID=A0ABR9TAR8_9SPHI|nr:hypothetical protein [Sphingobacterium pedocola]
MITRIPEGEDQPSDHPEKRETDEQFGDPESQNINKDPIIGGADDVHRENPSDDFHDSDLVDDEPLQSDSDRADGDYDESGSDQSGDEVSTPYDSDEEDTAITNLEDNEDLMDEDSAIDNETTR